MLDAWLDFHRATLLWKCTGLSDSDLKRRSVEPSSLSLLGLIRHLTEVERNWFRRYLAGENAPPLLHMIEEYARHNGHADLIRERIDGATGD
jgi:hypothetical protein